MVAVVNQKTVQSKGCSSLPSVCPFWPKAHLLSVGRVFCTMPIVQENLALEKLPCLTLLNPDPQIVTVL